jgi:hypothetical protein
VFNQRKNAFQRFADQIQRVDRFRSQFHGQRRLLVQIISNTNDDVLLVVATNDVRQKSPLIGGQRRTIVMHKQIDGSKLNNIDRARVIERETEGGDLTAGSWNRLFLELSTSAVDMEVVVVFVLLLLV